MVTIDGTQASDRSRFGLALGVIALVGLALRLWRIDVQSLWYDEAFSIAAASKDWDGLVADLVADVRHAPLHFVVLQGSLGVFGVGELGARLPSVVFGVAALVFAGLFARRLFGDRVGLLSASLLALSQLGVHYSQEARMYAPLLAFTACAAWLFVRAVLDGSRPAWWGFVLAATAAVYSHYYALLFVAAFVVWAWTERRRHWVPIRWWGGGMVLGALLFAPWAVAGTLGQMERVGGELAGDVPAWAAVHWDTFFVTLNQLGGGQVVRMGPRSPWWSHVATAVLILLPAAAGALRPLPSGPASSDERSGRRLCVLLVLVPIGLALLLGRLAHFQYVTRYLLPATVPLLALTALGLTSIASRPLRAVAITALVLWSLAGLRVTYFTVYKAPWRELFAYFVEARRPDDGCHFLPGGRVPLQWGIYHPDEPLRVVNEDLAARDRVWLVGFVPTPQHAELVRAAGRTLSSTHRDVERQEWWELTLTLYERRR